MDKRWRNLILIIVVIIVLALVVSNLSLITNLFEEQTLGIESTPLEQGFSEILTVFKANDVNFDNLQSNNLVVIKESGDFIWVEKKQNLVSLKTDLLEIRSNSFSKYPGVSGEMTTIIDLYLNLINFTLENEDNYKDLSLFLVSEFNCNLIDSAKDSNKFVFDRYLFLEELDTGVEDYAIEYDLFAQPLFISLEEERYSAISFSNAVTEVITNCGVIQ
jgi:hypothetical protein